MKYGFIGIHYWDIPPDPNLKTAFMWGYAMGIVYNPILAFVKISVLIFIIRFCGIVQWVRYAVFATFVFTVGLAIAMCLVVVFECIPIAATWDPAIEGQCIDIKYYGDSTAAMVILTDVVTLVIPLYVVFGLQMSARKRTTLMGVFALGVV